MNRIKTILVGLLFSLNGFSQSEVKVRILPTKIGTNTEMLIPLKSNEFLYEKYNYFKHVYWLLKQDTLIYDTDSIYRGDRVSVDFRIDCILKDSCDSLINYIRNSSLHFRTSSMLDDSARYYIGYDNTFFKPEKYRNSPSERDEYQLCHSDYKTLDLLWLNSQLIVIDSLKAYKEERCNYILKSDSTSEKFVSDFLKDFGSCEPDWIAIVELMSKNTDVFLRVCKKIPDTDFFSLKLKISDIPEVIKKDKALIALENSNVKTKRKNQLIRKLK